MKVILVQDLLKANTDQALQNRSLFDEHRVIVINLISAPGSGKTTLLEKTLALIKDRLYVGVIEGDISTTRDAERIASQAIPVVQINTQGACHLDAQMVAQALLELPLKELDLIFIENVGNLVCPASFDLGEHCKVAVLSVTEGSDKPAKYPEIFLKAHAVVMSKTDLLPYIDFNMEDCVAEMQGINKNLNVFPTSSKMGTGMADWIEWLEKLVQEKRGEVDVPCCNGKSIGSSI